MLPVRLTRRPVDLLRPQDANVCSAAGWTMKQLHDAALRIDDRIDNLTRDGIPPAHTARSD